MACHRQRQRRTFILTEFAYCSYAKIEGEKPHEFDQYPIRTIFGPSTVALIRSNKNLVAGNQIEPQYLSRNQSLCFFLEVEL